VAIFDYQPKKSKTMKNLIFSPLAIASLIICSLVGSAECQESKIGKSVFITGMVYDSKTQEPLGNTNYRINKNQGFVANELGRFSFLGSPGDSVIFSYVGYHTNRLVVPDTLKSEEYVMGVFMHEETVKLSEIIIFARIPTNSIMVTPVQSDEKAKNLAQSNIDKAVVESLTQSPKVYDAAMNAKQTMRTNQMRAEYKGMLVSPENSVGISSQNYRTNSLIFGSPILSRGRMAKEMITSSESAILLGHFEALKRIYGISGTPTDTSKLK
jgi:hypothetical protein